MEDEEIPKAQLYRQRRRNIEKVLCSLLVFNWQGDDGLAGAQLRDLNVEIGTKGVVTDREWLGSFEEKLSYSGDLEDTNVVLPSDLRRSMDKYVQEANDVKWMDDKFENRTSKNTYHKKLDFPFRLVSHELVKIADLPFGGISDRKRLMSAFGCLLLTAHDTPTTRNSHGMCAAQLDTLCGSNNWPSAGELAVVVWQIKRAMRSEKHIHGRIKVCSCRSEGLLSCNYPV
ncbi:hypothetical protein N7533_002642 [Penicillium manginii]|uniref:uncharacterized protein n=1 Tax=Penicillium manginii TaxID=203109 RepID=UPI002549B5DF|nr:uncharacterized protein N7533_002642 [Penicillium manginii]KAJ5763961.1 hypothetical protein N7533_002642 [Penicillium manginii]